MKKILILNLLVAGFLAGSAAACQPPDALGQLRQAAGQPGDCTVENGGNIGDWPPLPEFPMPSLPSQPPLQPDIMPCYWDATGPCGPGVPFPSFPGDGGTYCDETGPQICLGDNANFCFPVCVVVGPVYNGQIVYEAARGKSGAQDGLRQAYLGQSAAKALVAERLFRDNEAAKRALKSDKSVKVMADGKVVFLIFGSRVVRIGDSELAGRVQKLVAPSAGGPSLPGNKILFYAGAAIAIECMTDDACWGAVGDAVSAVSEWANS